MDSTITQQMFDLWKRQIEEGAEAWSRLLADAPAAPPDPAAFWRPFVEQWVQTCARNLAQTSLSPDLASQWKQFLDQSIEAWSRAIGHAMNTEAFARMLGQSLDRWLALAAPVKKATDQAVDMALETLNLPSRVQVTAVARQLVDLEERVERLEDGINAVLRRLEELVRAGRPARESA